MSLGARVLVVTGVLGCGAATTLSPATIDDAALSATSVPSGVFPKWIDDPLGAHVRIPTKPSRIASTSLATDELLFALAEPERVVAMTFLVDDAATTGLAGHVASTVARVSEEPEGILGLAPDLLVTAGYSRGESVRVIESAGVPVVRIGRHESLDDVLDAIGLLGRAIGEEDRAASLIASLTTRLSHVVARVESRATSKPRVLLWEGGCSYGRDTLQDDLIRRAGGVNVVSAAGMRGPVQLTEEALIALTPDVVITTTDVGKPFRDASLLGAAPVLAEVSAVRAGRVYGLPRRALGSVSHHAVAALEMLTDVLDELSSSARPEGS